MMSKSSLFILLGLLGIWLMGICGCSHTSPTANANDNTETAPPDTFTSLPASNEPPEVVLLPAEPDGLTEDDCPAEGVDSGLLDHSSMIYERIEYRLSPFYSEETAYLRDSPIRVKVVYGGCAHFGTRYTVTFPRDEVSTDVHERMTAALEIVRVLKIRKGVGDGDISLIDGVITPWIAKRAPLDECELQEGVTTTVRCAIETDGDSVNVSLSYDNAL